MVLFIKNTNLLLTVLLGITGLFFIDIYLIISAIILFIFSNIKRIDIIYIILLYHLNYTVGVIFLNFSPDKRLFYDIFSNSEKLNYTFFLTTIILLITTIIMIFTPIRGYISEQFIKNKSTLLYVSIPLILLFSALGFNRVGFAVNNSIAGYIIRVALIINMLFPLLFLIKEKKVSYFLLFIAIISSYLSGSRGVAFLLLTSLIQISLIYNWKVNYKYAIFLFLFVLISVFVFPIISSLRLGNTFSYGDNYSDQYLESIYNVRSRFGGIDVAYALKSTQYAFPWNQFIFEFSTAFNRYFPGDPFPVSSSYYPSEYFIGKYIAGVDFLQYSIDEIRYTESMRLGRFFVIDPFSIFVYFVIFYITLNIQTFDKITNYLLRFILITSWIGMGGFYETYFILFDIIIIASIMYFFFERNKKSNYA